MNQHFRQEKDRPSMWVDEPVKPKEQIDGESLGNSESNQVDYRKQHFDAYRAGYDYAYDVFMPRILELENLLRWYIKQNVAQMFQDIGYDGAEASRKRSTQQFWSEYQQERDAA